MRDFVRRVALVIIGCILQACLLPQEDTILPEQCTATTACSCDCTLCTARPEGGGACTSVTVQEHYSSTCFNFFGPEDGGTCPANIESAADAGALNRACSDFCERDLRANNIDTVQCVTKTQTLISNNDCVDRIEHPLHTTANGTATADKIRCNLSSSTISVSERDSSGKIVKSGSVQVECVGDVEEGSFHLQMLRIRAVAPLNFGSDQMKEIRAGLIKPLTGTIDSNGNFSFDGSQSLFAGTGFVGGERQNSVFSPMGAITGNYQRVGGSFAADMALSSEDGLTTLAVHLEGSTTNRAPEASIQAPATAECVGGQAVVVLDGSGSTDLDGMSLGSYLWYDGDRPLGEGQTLAVPLALGVHNIRLVVSDGVSLGIATKSVAVVDTQPPVVVVERVEHPCLWPVNHKLVRYELGRDIVVSLVDACDGARPVDGFAGAVSSQPEDALGDGTTAPDVVVAPNFVCLRAERSGTGNVERTYALTVTGRDSAGNVGTATLNVIVPHDQGGEAKCERLAENALLEDDDPQCTPPVTSSSSTNATATEEAPPSAGGCTATPGGCPSLIAFVFLVASRSRRRRAEA